MELKIIYNGTNEQLAKALRSPFFLQLKEILQNETPTLRRLKDVLGPKIDKELDFLISHQIVERKVKRYYLSIPVITPEQALIDGWSQKLVLYLKDKEQAEIYSLLEQLLAIESKETIYGIDSESNFCYRKTVSNGELSIHSLVLNEDTPTLPGYFEFLQTEQGNDYSEISNTLGDVSSEYYLNQTQVIIEKILNHSQSIRSNIFLKSIEQFGIVAKTENFKLLFPILEEVVINPFKEEFLQLSDVERHFIIAQTMKLLNTSSLTIIYLK